MPANTVPDRAADLLPSCLCLPDYFGFGDTTDIITKSQTHTPTDTHTHWPASWAGKNGENTHKQDFSTTVGNLLIFKLTQIVLGGTRREFFLSYTSLLKIRPGPRFLSLPPFNIVQGHKDDPAHILKEISITSKYYFLIFAFSWTMLQSYYFCILYAISSFI